MGGAQVATRQRVLIVDDDESMRLGTCEQALRLAEGQPYDKAAAERTLAAGANAFLVKPVRTAEVAAIIRKHMEGRSHA